MNKLRLRPFRAFVTNQYYENREEYTSCGQTQPYTFEQYLKENISLLRKKYRLTYRRRDSIV